MPSAKILIEHLKSSIARVLVVDDDQHILLGLQDILEDAGYRVEIASLADEALEMLQKEVFSLMIVDYALPDANGVEIARNVAAKYPWMAVVLMTGHDRLDISNSDAAPLLSAFLRKPVDVQTLLNVVETTMHRLCDRYHVPHFVPKSSATGAPPFPMRARSEAHVSYAEEAPTPPPEIFDKREERRWLLVATALSSLLVGLSMGWYGRGGASNPPVDSKTLSFDPVPVAVPEVVSASSLRSMPIPALKEEVPPPQPEPVIARPPPAPAVSAPVISKPSVDAPVETPPPPPPPAKQTRAERMAMWEPMLDSESPAIQMRAAKALLKIKPNHTKAINILISLLHATEPSQRLAAVEALSVSGVKSTQVMDKLAVLLSDSDPSVVFAAVSTLSRSGEAAMPVLPYVIDLLPLPTSSSKVARDMILAAGDKAVPGLIAKLDDERVRRQVVEILATLGPAAQSALPALTALESDPELGPFIQQAKTAIQPSNPDIPAP